MGCKAALYPRGNQRRAVRPAVGVTASEARAAGHVSAGDGLLVVQAQPQARRMQKTGLKAKATTGWTTGPNPGMEGKKASLSLASPS